jgi:hypothetical protein
VASHSHARVQGLVNVPPQRGRIHDRKPTPASKQTLCRKGLTRQRTQLGDRLAGTRDRDRLATRDTVDNLATTVAKLCDAHGRHGANCVTR